jgi:tetratricopeptide (TPR) repeat protein
MGSLISGFEYDIFISYRQKDNKGEKWVSEFVESLKTELESTFKESISVYFDVNPHDGLLETYDVDESLRKKLKCLVFIPIISKTYCDPNSFAWEHEFKAFIEQASVDRFGLKITLPNGNVINRILPVRIHDLDPEDIKLCETMLKGNLRGIEFVFKNSGVNRPLRPLEEHPHDNLNKTYYRDQINKVANSAEEIIAAIVHTDRHEEQIYTGSQEKQLRKKLRPGKKLILTAAGAVILIALLLILLPQNSKSLADETKTIAVLPFEKWFSDENYAYLTGSIPSTLSSDLRAIHTFDVRSYNSTNQYTGKDRPTISQIARECNVNTLILGSVSLANKNSYVEIHITIQNAKNEKILWEKSFPGKLDSLQELQSEIIREVAYQLKSDVSTEELSNIRTKLTKNSSAYASFLQANYQDEAMAMVLMGKIYQDSVSYERAISMYDKAIMYDSTFALAYARRSICRSFAYLSRYIPTNETIEKSKADAEKALQLNPKLAEGYNASGFYYYNKRDYNNALACFKKAGVLDSGNWVPAYYSAVVYRRIFNWTKSDSLMRAVLAHNPQDPLVLNNIGISYCYMRSYDSSIMYNDMAIKLMPNWYAPYINKFLTIILKNGDTNEARKIIDVAEKKCGDLFQRERIALDVYDRNFKNAIVKLESSNPDSFEDAGDRLLFYARIYDYSKDQVMAKIYYDSTLTYYLKRLGSSTNPMDFIQAGKAYAGLKNGKKAVETVRKGLDMITDPLRRHDNLIDLAEVYISSGDTKNGLKQIEELLKTRSLISIALLESDPVWDPLKNYPDYQGIINKFMNK